MRDIVQDLRLAIRRLLATPGATALAMLSLALGIGGTTVVFALINAIRLRPLPYAEPQRLLVLSESSPELCAGCGVGASYAVFQEWRQATAFEAAAYREQPFALAGGSGEPETVGGAVASANLFPLLGVQPLHGRGFLAAEEQPGAAPLLLGATLAERRFGDARAALGRVLRVDGRPHVVVGVMPRGLRYPEMADLWVPLRPELVGEDLAGRSLEVVARLRPGATRQRAAAEADAAVRAVERDAGSAAWRGIAQPLHESLAEESGPSFWLLFGAAALVLAIACANLANLLLARALDRRRELASRLALGASHRRLVRLVLAESLALAFGGGGLGLLLAGWGKRFAVAAIPSEIPYWIDFRLDWRVVAFTFGTAVVTALLVGIAPALQAARTPPAAVLKESSASVGTSRRLGRLRRGLVMLQVALTATLLVAAGVFARSFFRWSATTDLGYQPRGILQAQLPLLEPRYDEPGRVAVLASAVVERLARRGDVTAAAAERDEFLGTFVGSASAVRLPGEAEAVPAALAPRFAMAVTPDYLRVLQLRLLAGRFVEARDGAGAPPVAVVDRAAAEALWPGKDPLGQRLSIGAGGEALTVVGVVADVTLSPAAHRASKVIYTSLAQRPGRPVTLLVRTAGAPAPFAASLRREVRAVDPDQPVDEVMTRVAFLKQWIGPVVFLQRLFLALGIVALLLATLGIYSVGAYSVARRGHEMAIRMALGAAARQVVRLVVREGVTVAAAGLAIGSVAAVLGCLLLRRLLYGVLAPELGVFLVVLPLLAAVAAGASWLPARRAARTEPRTALARE
jgi:putative ABC transport system permease protein